MALLLSAYAIVTAGVLAALLLQLRADAIAAAENVLGAFAQLANEQTARTIQNVDETLQAAAAILSGAPGPASTRNEAINAALGKLLEGRPFLRTLSLVNEQGRSIYSNEARALGVDVSNRDYFLRHREDSRAGFLFGPPLRSEIDGEWVIPATRAWRSANGDFAGVIVAGVNPRFFERAWTFDKEIQDVAIGLWRNDGLMLVRSPFDDRAMGLCLVSGPLVSRMRGTSDSGTYRVVSFIDGRDRLVAYHRLSAYPGFSLTVSQTTDQVLAGWRYIAWIVVVGWAIAVAAVAALAVWLVRESLSRRTNDDRYRMMFEGNPFPMYVVEPRTLRFLAVNEATIEYGWSREEFLSMTIFDIRPPEDVPTVKEALESRGLVSGKTIRGQRHRKRDGTIIDVELIARVIEFDGKRAMLVLTLDVTDRIQGERARHATEEQLRQSQKMEAVGQLTGGVAHDFNNILMVIQANVEAILEDDGMAADVAARLDRVSNATQRAAGLTRQLLAFSRKQRLHPQQTDINDLVAAIGKLLRRALGAQIEIESVLADNLYLVNVDRTQLETALVNLCVNARDAMPDGGRLLIETRNVTLDEKYVAHHPEAVAGDYAMLAVTDTGSGIPPDALGKVFEPFFTTKEVGKGTGLGLSMVYGFIKQSNGHIEIRSELGRGTSFKLYLPRSDGLSEEPAAEQGKTMPGGAERILIVEDDSQVRAAVVQQMQSLGYAVSQAGDGAEAVIALEAATPPYDLLLTDLVMPGPLNGQALADEVSRRWPQTKIVFMSGYTETAITLHGRLDAAVLLLSKPFRKSDLARIVRQALDGAPAI